MSFGEKIKIFAKKNGGLTKLAEKMGMSVPNLSQYANNHSEPGLAIIKRLFQAGCDINWLLEDDPGVVKEKKEYFGASEKDIIRSQQEEIKQLKERLHKIEKLLK